MDKEEEFDHLVQGDGSPIESRPPRHQRKPRFTLFDRNHTGRVRQRHFRYEWLAIGVGIFTLLLDKDDHTVWITNNKEKN